DSGLNESYIKLLEEGKKLTLNYNTFISQYQTITNQTDFSINITRSLTRLKICICFIMERLCSSSENYNSRI
ncbi:MAG: hypothetical protein ACKPKO_29325, partial [Candidatus Fonsibacter sp.]